jgi:DNA-binding CsgD family transcriptional regulator/PAS domain-containing protein
MAIQKMAGENFVAAVEAIYGAAPEPSRWPFALQAIADVFDDIGVVLMWRRDDGGFGTIVSPSLVEAQRDYLVNGWYLRDLCAQRTVDRALWLRGDAATDRDAVSDEEMEKHPIYTDFFRRHDLRWRAIIGVAPDPHVSVFIAIQRSSRKQPHTEAELALAIRLGRHVEKSLRLGIRLMDSDVGTVGLRDALTRLGVGVFALDSLGRVVFSNAAGERLLGQEIRIVDGRLRMGIGQQRAETDAMIAQTVRGEPVRMTADPRPILIHRASCDRALVAYLLPMTPHGDAAEVFFSRTRAFVLVIDPKPNDPTDPAVVRDVLGLTLGEARVAALIGAGVPPRKASERLGISEESARTVLKRIYVKTGIARQSELAALLSRIALISLSGQAL